MNGELNGRFFKSLIGAMLERTANFLSDFKSRIEEMDDEHWYSWARYQEMARRIGEVLGDNTTKAVGWRIIESNKALFLRAGVQHHRQTPASLSRHVQCEYLSSAGRRYLRHRCRFRLVQYLDHLLVATSLLLHAVSWANLRMDLGLPTARRCSDA